MVKRQKSKQRHTRNMFTTMMNIFTFIQKKALLCIQCPPIEGFNVPHMGCIIRTCEKCPKYKMNKYEKSLKNNDPEIAFHDFTVKKKCTVHGILDSKSKECSHCSTVHRREKRVNFK